LRDWRRQNQKEGKKITILTQQIDKSIQWKASKTIFSPTNIYQVFEPLAKKPTVLVVQASIEETLLSPSEKTR
jgi:hypothetical protein